MALFTEHAGRTREPLGGREADGFEAWLTATERQVREAAEHLQGTPAPMAYVAVSAARDYHRVLTEWRYVKTGRSPHVRDDLVRDHFEVGLIAHVMSAYGVAEYARTMGRGPRNDTAGGRPVADISAEYLRACMTLAQYTGLNDVTVAACRDDQAALMALRNTRV